jgi:biopolymer transport protein ExbD
MKKVLGFILFAAIIALAIWALLHFKGFGGFGKDSVKSNKNDTSVIETTKTAATTTEDKKQESAEITVSGNDYLYNNEKLTLDKLAAEISKLDKDAEITITSDDTAAKNTVDELTDKLEELGYNNFKKADK